MATVDELLKLSRWLQSLGDQVKTDPKGAAIDYARGAAGGVADLADFVRGGTIPGSNVQPLGWGDSLRKALGATGSAVEDAGNLFGVPTPAGAAAKAGVIAKGWGPALVAALGTFAGVGAKTADVVKLAKAKEMVKAGADPVEVWKQTGWTDQFPDGKWRFEIPDTDARFKYVKATDKGVTTAERLDHPQLDAAYPDLAAVPKDIKFGNRVQSSGSYRDTPAESISAHGVDPNDAYGIVFHEGQHAVQRREGFAQGGSPESMYDLLEKEARNANKAGDYKRARQLREQQSIAIWDGMGPYRRLAGEAEARLTQARANLTPAERAARPPWLEFDVPREQQIVRGLLGENTGPAMSVREPTKFQLAHAEAQRNAALPVEQGGLELGPQNTAMERAKAMGFDTDVYHGTHSRPIGAGNETPDIEEFVPSASFGSPDPAVFVTRDKGMANAFARNYVDNTGAIYPLKVRTNAGQITETADHARNNEMLVHNPALLRSRFAAFDPKKKDSRDLLASLGLLGLLGAGAYGQNQ